MLSGDHALPPPTRADDVVNGEPLGADSGVLGCVDGADDVIASDGLCRNENGLA